MTIEEYAREMIDENGIEKSLIMCDEEIYKVNSSREALFPRIQKRMAWDAIKREIEKLKIAKT